MKNSFDASRGAETNLPDAVCGRDLWIDVNWMF